MKANQTIEIKGMGTMTVGQAEAAGLLPAQVKERLQNSLARIEKEEGENSEMANHLRSQINAL